MSIALPGVGKIGLIDIDSCVNNEMSNKVARLKRYIFLNANY
jgi:hypothetical protein